MEHRQIKETIAFKNIDFKYNDREKLFKNLNLAIPRSKITAIVGESGSGKSTLGFLLQNKYALQNGTVSIGSLDLSQIDNALLNERIATVQQQLSLYVGSITSNIVGSTSVPNMGEILRICKSIGILEFINTLPNGFNTPLGKGGVMLSGGQKQKIGIARALYQDPEILILDEAMSALDSKSETYIQKAIIDLKRKNKTIIIITHRLSSVVYADNIVVLQKGKVLEQGDHDTLYAKKSHYHKLWQQHLPILEY